MKHALKIIGYVVAFLISSIVILAFLIDANMFKPRIASLALERGIVVNMRGDLHWAFWPSVGLAVHDVSIASTETPDAPIADVKKASFLIAFIPLMQGNFQVKHILVDGAAINLEVNAQGKGNWEALKQSQKNYTNTEKPRVNVDGSVSGSDLHLSIEKISLEHSAISYTDISKNKRIQLNDIQLNVTDVNTTNDPFDMDFSWVAQVSSAKITDKNTSQAMTIKGKLHNRIALNANFTSIALSNGELKLDLTAKSSATIAINYALTIDHTDSNLSYTGNVSLPGFNAKKILAIFDSDIKTANEKSLTDVAFASDINGDLKKINVKNINLQLDKTHIKGELSINDIANHIIVANLQSDELNADDYLAPKAEAQPLTNNTIAADHDAPLPLELLRRLNVNVKITFAKLIFSDLALEKAQLDVDAKNGVIEQQLSADAYSGSVHEKITMNAGENTAHIQFESILHAIQVAPLLKDKKLDKSINLSGAIEANASGQTNGATKSQLLNALVAKANFSGAQMRLAPINIEQHFCQMINLISKTEAPAKTWNNYTELHELSGKITIADRIITVDSMNAGVEKLSLNSSGTINLANGNYDFVLPLKLNRNNNDTAISIITSAQGCTVNSNYWAERSMALLRCKGIYAEINPIKDCRPDKDMLTAVVKDFAEYKLREKHGEKIDAKKAALIKKLDDKLGGEGQAEKAKSLLKNLFKKNTDTKEQQ